MSPKLATQSVAAKQFDCKDSMDSVLVISRQRSNAEHKDRGERAEIEIKALVLFPSAEAEESGIRRLLPQCGVDDGGEDSVDRDRSNTEFKEMGDSADCAETADWLASDMRADRRIGDFPQHGDAGAGDALDGEELGIISSDRSKTEHNDGDDSAEKEGKIPAFELDVKSIKNDSSCSDSCPLLSLLSGDNSNMESWDVADKLETVVMKSNLTGDSERLDDGV